MIRSTLTFAGIALMLGGAALVTAYGGVRLGSTAAPPPDGDISVAFYAQNQHFTEPPWLRMDASALGLRIAPKWVQRGVLVTDREPLHCVREPRRLHVFTLPTDGATYYAIGFILDPHRNDLGCMVAVREHFRLHYHPTTFAAVDALLRRGKLEYVAHPALRELPQAQYPLHDRIMLPVTFE